MNEIDDKPERLQLIIALFALFPTLQVKDETYKAYLHMLSDIPLEVLTAAVEQSAAGSKFPPTVAEIRDTALRLVTPARPEGAEAWGTVVKALSEVGFYRSPKFDDPLTQKMVDIIGWQTLCSSENSVADRAHFIQNYNVLVAREVADAKLLPRAREIRELASARAREITDGRRTAFDSNDNNQSDSRSLERTH